MESLSQSNTWPLKKKRIITWTQEAADSRVPDSAVTITKRVKRRQVEKGQADVKTMSVLPFPSP